MVDGDMEFVSTQGQYGWIAFDNSGNPLSVLYATGGQCTSGVRCLVANGTTNYLGWYMAPKTGNIQVSLKVKPSSGKCADVIVYSLDINNQTAMGDAILPMAAAPDATGWCTFQGTASNLAGKIPALQVTVATPSTPSAILDDAVITPMGTQLRGSSIVQRALSAEEAARLRAFAAYIRSHWIN